MRRGASRSRWSPAPIWAALVLWGCLVMLSRFLHPAAMREATPPGALPFASASGPGGDYYQFWVVGRAVSTQGFMNIYAVENRKALADFGQDLARSSPPAAKRLSQSAALRHRMIQTFSTPFLYAAIGWLGTSDYERDYDAYLNLCLAALLASILSLGLLLGFPLVECLLFAAVMLICSAPLASDLWWGNVNQLQLAGLTLYLLSRRWPDLAGMDLFGGFVLGLLVAFKPTLAPIPLLLVAAFSLDRRWGALWRHAAGALVAVAFAFVAGSHFLRSWTAWGDWFAVLPSIDRFTPSNGNYSLARMLTETWGGDVSGVQTTALLLLLCILGVTLLLIWRSRLAGPVDAEQRMRWFERDLGVAVLGSGVSVVSSNLVWEHYLLLLIPLFLYVSRARARAAVTGLVLPTLALLALLGRPVAFFVDPESFAYTLVCTAGAWGLLVLGWLAFRRGAPASA